MAVGNIDGNPAPDIVALNSRADPAARCFSGDGNGFYTPSGTIPTGPAPQDLALVDINGDGKLDLIIADANADAVEVRLGHGDNAPLPPRRPMRSAPHRTASPSASSTATSCSTSS